MSRQGLAEAVNTYLAENDLPTLSLGATCIGKRERAVVRWPRTNLRQPLRAILGATMDADLGFDP